MLLAAIVTLILGVLVSLLGFKLFRVLLPVAGLVIGAMVGFSGVQAVLGTGAVSTSLAILVALMVGVLMGVLSFVFFDFAVMVFSAIIGASMLSFLGVAVGLNEQGFLVFLLALAGAILGFMFAAATPLPATLVLVVTSFAGVAMIMSSVMLISGNVSLDDLLNDGVIGTVVRVVDQSFLWLLVWIGGSFVALNFQRRMLLLDLFTDDLQYSAKSTK